MRDQKVDMLGRVIVITAVSNSMLETLLDQHLLAKVVRKPSELNELMTAVEAYARPTATGYVAKTGRHMSGEATDIYRGADLSLHARPAVT